MSGRNDVREPSSTLYDDAATAHIDKCVGRPEVNRDVAIEKGVF